MVDDIFEFLFGHAARLAVDDLALGIYDDGRWDRAHTVEVCRITVCIEYDGKIGLALRHKLLHRLRFLLEIDRVEIRLIAVRCGHHVAQKLIT